ncbi:uncharacterized protein [Haliotis cracherodii]|uniref:uncharacterized protein n=1 Tax=Haliotis cracherodii TaxID=6455 RepID=UPI0039E887B4
MSYVKDKRGVPRGSCGCGQCAHYVPQTEGHACGYCGCLPVKHEDLRKITNLQKSFPILETDTEIASEDELPVILGPSRPRKSKDFPDRLDAPVCSPEQDTTTTSGTKMHSNLGSDSTNKIPNDVGLAKSTQDSQVHGSQNMKLPKYINTDRVTEVPPCELLQSNHMPYYELPDKQPMKGVYKIAYKHKTIYIGKSLNIRRHLKRLMPGRLSQEIGKFLKNLPKKKKKYLTVFWIDSDLYKHNCKGRSYFKCITRIQGEKPKYSYPKKFSDAGGGGVATGVMCTPGDTSMITTAVQDSQVEAPPRTQDTPIGVDPTRGRKKWKRSGSTPQAHSSLIRAGQGRGKKCLGSGNHLKEKADVVMLGDKMTKTNKPMKKVAYFESDRQDPESEVGKLTSLKGKCQRKRKKSKTSATSLLSEALQPKSTRSSTKEFSPSSGRKELSTKTKLCSVLLDKKRFVIQEAKVKIPPCDQLEKKTPDTEVCSGVERVKSLASHNMKTQHVPCIEETTVTKSSKVTVVKVEREDVTKTTRYADTALSSTSQGSAGGPPVFSGQDHQFTNMRLNTSTPIPVSSTEDKNDSGSIYKEEKSDQEYSLQGVPFTLEDKQEWIPDILADSEDSMKLIIDEQQCAYSPGRSKWTHENWPESPIAPCKREQVNSNESFRFDSRSSKEEDGASVPASPGNREDTPESSTTISTQRVSVSPVKWQPATNASATDSFRTQTVKLSDGLNSFGEDKVVPSKPESSASPDSINSCSVAQGRLVGTADGKTHIGLTDEKAPTDTLACIAPGDVHPDTSLSSATNDTKPIKPFLDNNALDSTTKFPPGKNSRCDTRIVVCEQRSWHAGASSSQYKNTSYRRESRPVFDNIEHWRSHQRHFMSNGCSRRYTNRERTFDRVEYRHGNMDIKDTALVKTEGPDPW